MNLEELIKLRTDLKNLAPLDPAVQSSTIPSATVEPPVDNDVSESAVNALKDDDSMLESLIGAKKSILEARKASLVDNNQAISVSQSDSSQINDSISSIQDDAPEINGNWSIASVRQGIRYRDLLTNAQGKGDTQSAIQKDQSVTAIQTEQVITITKLHELTSKILHDLNPPNEPGATHGEQSPQISTISQFVNPESKDPSTIVRGLDVCIDELQACEKFLNETNSQQNLYVRNLLID